MNDHVGKEVEAINGEFKSNQGEIIVTTMIQHKSTLNIFGSFLDNAGTWVGRKSFKKMAKGSGEYKKTKKKCENI